MSTTNQDASHKFESEVLDYIRKSNVGAKRVGVGALSVNSNQRGNTDLARAILGFKRSESGGEFDQLNKIGKNLLEKISELAEESITADADVNKVNLEQIKVLKELLPLVSEGTEEQRKSKSELISFIGKTEKGMLKNASFKNRLVEFTKSMLPSAAGIVAGIFSKSPVLGAIVNFGMEKLEQRSERKRSLKKDNVKGLLGVFDEIVKKGQKDEEDEPQKKYGPSSSPLESTNGSEPVPVRIVEASERAAQVLARPVVESSDDGPGGLDDFLGGIRDALVNSGITDENDISEAVNQVRDMIMQESGGDPKKIQEILLSAVEATLEEGETLQRIETALSGSEEKAREQEFQMDKQNSILERIADSTSIGGISGKDGESKGVGGLIGGLLGGGLKDKILQWIGIGAVGSTALSKFSRVFSVFGSIATKVFNLTKGFTPVLGKVFSKIFSFPVQFVVAVLNGIKRSAQSVMRGEGIGTAIKEGIYGFANWFLAGFLEKIQNWVSGHRLLDPIFRAVDEVIGTVKGFFTGIYDKAKSNFTAVMDFISSPIDGVRNMALGVQEYWESIVGQIRALITNPREFITARVDQIRDGMKKFFYGMVPSWIPLKFIPEAIRDDVKKARYGATGDTDAQVNSKALNAPNFVDNLSNEFGGASTPAAAASTGSSGSSSRGGRRSNEEDSDNLSLIAERMRAAQGDPNQGTTGAPVRSTQADDFIGRLIKREGGFVNDPDDRGGATNMGITQDTLSKYLGKKASIEDVRGLKEETARDIYDKEYLKPFGDVKDDNLKEFLLDFGAHSGTERVKGFYNKAKEGSGSEQETLEKLIARRGELFKNIIKNDPSQKKYEKGWNNRLKEFENKAKESRANLMYATDRQVVNAEKKSSAPSIASVSNKTSNTSVNNTTVSKRSPVNQDPSARFYAPSLATA